MFFFVVQLKSVLGKVLLILSVFGLGVLWGAIDGGGLADAFSARIKFLE